MIPNPYEQKQSPEGVILEILSRKAGISSKELYDFFLAKYKTGMTLQGFYKVLRQLLQDRVIVKSNGTLSLYSAWVQNLVTFAERAEQTYLSNELSKATIVLDEGETSHYTFDRVTEMDTFWDHALLTVASYYSDAPHENKNAYSKNYYAWIQLLRTNGSVQLASLYTQMDMSWFMASGSHSFLNRIVSQQHTAPNFFFTLYEKLEGYGEGEDNFHVTVLGDFVFETKVPNYIFKMIKAKYESIKTFSEFNIDEMQGLIHQPGKTTLTISRDSVRAESIRKEIKALFPEIHN
jgi:hypothetical protein